MRPQQLVALRNGSVLFLPHLRRQVNVGGIEQPAIAVGLREGHGSRLGFDALLPPQPEADQAEEDEDGGGQGELDTAAFALFGRTHFGRRTLQLRLPRAFLDAGQIAGDRGCHRPGVTRTGLPLAATGTAGTNPPAWRPRRIGRAGPSASASFPRIAMQPDVLARLAGIRRLVRSE